MQKHAHCSRSSLRGAALVRRCGFGEASDGGELHLPDGPGLGVDLDLAAVRRLERR